MNTAAPAPPDLRSMLEELRASMASECARKGVRGKLAAAILRLLETLLTIVADFRAGRLAAPEAPAPILPRAAKAGEKAAIGGACPTTHAPGADQVCEPACAPEASESRRAAGVSRGRRPAAAASAGRPAHAGAGRGTARDPGNAAGAPRSASARVAEPVGSRRGKRRRSPFVMASRRRRPMRAAAVRERLFFKNAVLARMHNCVYFVSVKQLRAAKAGLPRHSPPPPGGVLLCFHNSKAQGAP